ncbi:hypothetical protein K470DRAFT_299580 [Piedraia hortae CBS 480.64]|uniref:Transmembrane protein n=1 Tax=Piedraia hortae CBS 480.64 TaxID=1314780 RepID=A0A6A7C1E7_9PEZI|nr:hypothetical protein K470DRAFT_299580 [Piedraia hortae CBS 480.64]
MSADSVALLRNGLGPDLGKLAEEHLKHDLRPSDRDALKKAATTFRTHAMVGSAVGLGLGVFLAARLRSARNLAFKAFQKSEKPVAIRFPSGREEPVPDVTAMIAPSGAGSFATYTLLGLGGLFLGGETGFLTGGLHAKSQINRDRESRERIQKAYRHFQADALRAQATRLENEDNYDVSI